MSTRLKQRGGIEFLSAEKITPIEIHRRSKAVCSDDVVDRSIINSWIIYFCGCEPGKAIIFDKTCSELPITASDNKHLKLVIELILNCGGITQKYIANHFGIFKEHVSFITEQLEFRKICAR